MTLWQCGMRYDAPWHFDWNKDIQQNEQLLYFSYFYSKHKSWGVPMIYVLDITQTRPCNIQQYFTTVKCYFQMKILKVFLFLLKTLIVGTR